MSSSKNQFSLVEIQPDSRIGEVGVWTTIFNALADLKESNGDQVNTKNLNLKNKETLQVTFNFSL